MNKEMIFDHLALADKHVAQGERHIARQRELIEEMKRKGHDTFTAEELLRMFEETQASHIADRNRLLRESEKPSAPVQPADVLRHPLRT